VESEPVAAGGVQHPLREAPAPPSAPPPPPLRLISSIPSGDWRSRATHSLVQLRHLTHRASLNASRLPLLKGAQLLQTVVLGLLLGLAFLQLGHDQTAVQNRLGCVYFVAICVIFANTLAVVLNCQPTNQKHHTPTSSSRTHAPPACVG
jgi:hypothetical protein